MTSKTNTYLNLTGVLIIALFSTPSAFADGESSFDDIVVFGDSLSDSGNVFALVGATSQAPYSPVPSLPYEGGRFTNGRTWIENVTRELDLRDSGLATFANPLGGNYAFAGARAIGGSSVPDMTTQVGIYLTSTGFAADPDTLYVVGFGGNDIRDLLAGVPGALGNDASVSAIIGNIELLASLGATQFLVMNAPDLGLVPAVPDPARPIATQLSADFNQKLSAGLDALPAEIHVTRLDLFGFLNAVVASPKSFGIKNAESPCLAFFTVTDAVCDKPNKRLFWDAIHPTRRGHKALAQLALEELGYDEHDDD